MGVAFFIMKLYFRSLFVLFIFCCMVSWFSKNSVYQLFGNRKECFFTEGTQPCFQGAVFTLCTVLTRGESSVK